MVAKDRGSGATARAKLALVPDDRCRVAVHVCIESATSAATGLDPSRPAHGVAHPDAGLPAGQSWRRVRRAPVHRLCRSRSGGAGSSRSAEGVHCIRRSAGIVARACPILRDTRGRLIDELGIDPSAALRQLESDILGQSSILDCHPPTSSAPFLQRAMASVVDLGAGGPWTQCANDGPVNDGTAAAEALHGVGGVGKPRWRSGTRTATPGTSTPMRIAAMPMRYWSPPTGLGAESRR
jgi:hypothetical protein